MNTHQLIAEFQDRIGDAIRRHFNEERRTPTRGIEPFDPDDVKAKWLEKKSGYESEAPEDMKSFLREKVWEQIEKKYGHHEEMYGEVGPGVDGKPDEVFKKPKKSPHWGERHRDRCASWIEYGADHALQRRTLLAEETKDGDLLYTMPQDMRDWLSQELEPAPRPRVQEWIQDATDELVWD